MSRATTGYASTQRPLSVFISYAHEDEQYRRELDRHLTFLRRGGRLSIWHDRMLRAGDEWEHHIDEQLEVADIILLLISPAFAASEYCWSVETKRALERYEQNDTIVVPILIRPVAGWADTPIGRLQALPRNARPVASWPNRDEAFYSIAEGLRELVGNASREVTYAEPEWRDWYLRLGGAPEEYPLSRINTIIAKLRKAANSEKLEFQEVLPGSTKLSLRSTQNVLDSLSRLHAAGDLTGRIGAEVLDIQPDTGAVLSIQSRIVDGEYRSTIRYLPEMFGGRALEAGFPPLVGGIEFPMNNPLNIGFSLLVDATHEMPTQAEQVELQQRLGRYLNTFLVLSGEQVNVTLTPTDDYCGLPELLRHTELGRDMLAQDVVLKHYTASQLHPSRPHGRAFWDKVNALTSGRRNFESCYRVWIVPGEACVHEKTVDQQGHVAIEKLGLKVLCEEDYETLRRYRESERRGAEVAHMPEWDAQVVALFKELILPEIQKEVSSGPRFGLLRQVLSVLVVANWIMQSQLGDMLRKAGFIGSNEPQRYGLNTVDEAVLLSMKRLYLRMFGDGVWQHTATRIEPGSGLVEKRLYVAGGIVVCPSESPELGTRDSDCGCAASLAAQSIVVYPKNSRRLLSYGSLGTQSRGRH